MPGETSQTLHRGLRLLELVASAPAGYAIADLSRQLGLNRTVVYRLVTTLEEHGLTRRSPGGRVTAGLGLYRLGCLVQPVLQATATPVLRTLADEAEATAHFTVAEGDEAVAVAVVEPRWTDFHVAYRVGARHDVGAAAAGKAIVLGRRMSAGDGSDTAETASGGEAGEAGTESMYVSSVGELQRGAHGISAPVLGVDGLEASVGLISLFDLDEPEVGPRVVAAARAIGRALS